MPEPEESKTSRWLSPLRLSAISAITFSLASLLAVVNLCGSGGTSIIGSVGLLVCLLSVVGILAGIVWGLIRVIQRTLRKRM